MKNWHCFENGILRVTWLSEQEANEWVERHNGCFGGGFYAIKLDNLHGMVVGGVQCD